MKNLRGVDHYDIGLDIGTGSVGWAVTDEDGDLCRFKAKSTWGSRVFDNANPASEARAPRGQRRRYERRRWRLNLLQGFFAKEIEKVDPEFFIRLSQSRLHPEDRAEGHADYHWPLFNGSDFTEVDYYKKFPTIYHLRTWLMNDDEKADIRLIYLAFHNIVKHRGNFLHQENPSLSAKNASMKRSLETFCIALEDWCQVMDIDGCLCDAAALSEILENPSTPKREKQESVEKAISFGTFAGGKKMAKAISQAFVGYKPDFAHIFLAEGEGTKFALSDDEKKEAFLLICPDEGLPLFEAMEAVYSSFVLLGILKGANGETISACKVRDYNCYHGDLVLLKSLVKEYAPGEYNRFFRGAVYGADANAALSKKARYDVSKAEGYTRYNMGPSKLGSSPKAKGTYEDFVTAVKKLFEGTAAVRDERYLDMMRRFDEETFLRRLKTSDNGSIPYQLHLEEMDAIIDNQKQYYPFLEVERDKIRSLVQFRIPYYVGPLTTKGAAKSSDGSLRFAWSHRYSGKENETIYPWNWDTIIDKGKSAQSFIERMTGTCTYLYGEPVLPKCSLLYEEYCVLNELNGARFTQDGDHERRFDFDQRMGIIEDIFSRGTATYKKVADWMVEHEGFSNVHVRGGQGETRFESRLSSYIFFCKDVFGVDELSDSMRTIAEEIILWNTLFEDRSILKEQLEQKYGEVLSVDQIKTICKKRFTGWGRLSKKLLVEMKVETDNGPYSIMDVLREGNPNNTRRSDSMVFMEILRDDQLGFQKVIDEENRKRLAEGDLTKLEDSPGSPALRRSINQTLRVVEEIVAIAGHAPDHIFIEVTREEDARNKGRRTRSRWNNLDAALKKLKEEAPEYWNSQVASELKGCKGQRGLDERLMLYFMQNGKSLYSGKPLDIRRLSEYQVDHIIPQSYIKDDSFENKALVLPGENQSKSDSLLISSEIRGKMKHQWGVLHRAGLIGDKKYQNLMRDRLSEEKLKGFIARQLVETSQVVKTVQMLLQERYSETRVLSVKASLSSQLREAKNFAKCRVINDYHHAHDAFLATTMGRFILYRHAGMYDNPIGYTYVMRQFVRAQSDQVKKGRMPGSAGFIVQSFLRDGFDKETGEVFKDAWDAESEVRRIRESLNRKDCFISRMPFEDSGAFWDSTIYSPRSGKNLSLRLKQDLDPTRYGAYSSEKFTYFFAYEAKNRKSGKRSFEFDAVPISVAASLKGDAGALEKHAEVLANAKGLDFVRIARKKIEKYQLIEINGERFYITGKKEMRNAKALAFSQAETKVFARIVDEIEAKGTGRAFAGDPTTQEERLALFDRVVSGYSRYAKRLGKLIKINGLRSSFEDALGDEQRSVLVSLVLIAAAQLNAINLSSVGGAASSGKIQPTFSKEMNAKDSDFIFIDQSVTGMFERRTRLEL